MDDIDKNSLIWGNFMSSSLNAAVLHGKTYLENLHTIRNQEEKLTANQLSEALQRLIKDQPEISGVSQICRKTYTLGKNILIT